MKRYLFLSLLLIISLAVSACNSAEGPPKNSGTEECSDAEPVITEAVVYDSAASLIEAISSDATPGRPLENPVPPGSRLPVESLLQASNALVGKQITVAVGTEEEMLYVFRPASDTHPEQLLLLYRAEPTVGESVMLTLETDYGDLTAFYQRFRGTAVGRVKTVDFVCGNDFTLTGASIEAMVRESWLSSALVSADAAIASYGYSPLGYESAFSTTVSEHAESYFILCERFGLE